MVCESGETSQEKNNPEKNWVYGAKIYAEDFNILRHQAGTAPGQIDEIRKTSKHFASSPDWSKKFKQFLASQAQGNEAEMNIHSAAKLAASRSNPEEKLTTAIVLAREGFCVCSLAAASDIAKRKELTRNDRLDACIAVLENITANKPIVNNRSTNTEVNKEWLYTSRLNLIITKILNLIIDLYQNEEELDQLSLLIEEVLNLESEKGLTKPGITERIALDLANKRNLLIRELSQTYEKPIIRSIHHLACTGGTLMSKCIASMPNVALISEVNPMNRYDSNFTPTNPLLLLERSYRTFTTEEKIDIFKMQIAKAMQLCQKDDVDLILRDHSHTDFCRESKESDVCAIKDYLSEDYHLIHVLTVRHPLDSYLSLIENGWEHFYPRGINEYSKRYLAFIDKYSSSEIIRYEDFCEDPVEAMKKLCSILRIGYDDNFMNTFGDKILSGDSGRRDIKTIEKRSRKPIPSKIKSQIESSEYYSKLIDLLSY